ncbi:MAG: siphovirus Gp157 family protein [Pseudomonadota bacterium]
MSAPSIYSLAQAWADLTAMLERIDDEGLDADATAMITAWLSSLEGQTQAKLDDMGKFLRMLELDAAAANAEAERLRARAVASERKAGRVKQAVMDMMAVAGLKTMRTASFTFSRCTNGGKQPIVIGDVDPGEVMATHPDLVVVKTEINKEAVRNALEAGDSLPFAQLAPRGEHLKVR